MAEEKEQKTQEGGTTETTESGDFDRLLNDNFKPTSNRQQEDIKQAVGTLAEYALRETTVISDDVQETVGGIIAELDKLLSDQINEIIHNEEFQRLEGAWRGLNHLVFNTETDETLKIRVLNIKKQELTKNFKRFKGAAWDQSPLFKKIYGEEYDVLGGSPYGCIVGDYYFDHSPPDVEILDGMAKIAAAAHAPFIAGTSPKVLNMETWQELSNPRDLTKIFEAPDYAAWRSLRDAEDSRYLGLAMPRFLSRLPYGEKTDPVEEFNFEEDTAGADHSKYCWANSAYAMAVNVTTAFKQYGWCTRIRGVESGGAFTGLPTHTFPTDDGGVDMKCPTEIAIGDRREKELAKNGFMPLLHRKNTDQAAFIGAQSLQKAAEYDKAEATANAALSANLPYMFAVCRFAHYLKVMVRDKIGGFAERADMERFLNNWIIKYVEQNPSAANDTDKARRPLAGASVEVAEIEGAPGYYSAKFHLRPHYQLEGLDVSLSLVSKLPS